MAGEALPGSGDNRQVKPAASTGLPFMDLSGPKRQEAVSIIRLPDRIKREPISYGGFIWMSEFVSREIFC